MRLIDNMKTEELKPAFYLVSGFWTLILLVALVWHYFETRENMLLLAHQTAVESIRKDMLYRRWAAERGGVYAPVSGKTPPNPYLTNVKERDIVTPSGRMLTLVNPAYMTRQVHELALDRSEISGHLTSLSPQNPQNAPDEWETNALRNIELGKGEFSGLALINGEEFYRLLQPMRIEAPCLKCHAAQGYKQGDLRGGISVSIPMKPTRMQIREQVVSDLMRLFVIWIVGLAAIITTTQFLRRRIAERQHAEQALRESEARWRTIVESEPECVKLLDRDGLLLEMNPAGLEMIQADLGQVRGERVVDLVAEKDRADFEEMVAAVFRGERRQLEFDMVGLKGRRLTLETISVPLRDPVDNTTVKALLGVSRDVTEHKLLEQQLRQSQKMEAIGQFAGGVAHDFSNLLQVINTFGFLIEGQLKENSLPVQFVEEQQVAIKRATRLTQALLTFSRQQVSEPKLQDINLAVEEAHKLLRYITGKNVLLTVELQPDELRVCVDEGQIYQVLMNLVVNARDAMPEGGQLVIATSRVNPDSAFRERHGCGAAGEFALLSVADTGHGMDKDCLARIFEPFYTTKADGKGTGLGLAISYGIVQQHHGIVEVASAPGEGTTFRIYLPLAG